MIRRAYIARACAAVMLIGVLFWLRDPAWLATVESGFSRWQTADQTKYRWTAGRASFFIASSIPEVRIPIRAGRKPEGWPIVVTISVDDRVADRVTLTDDAWHVSDIRLPPPESRRVRRIDLHVDRTIDGSRGVQVGEVQVNR